MKKILSFALIMFVATMAPAFGAVECGLGDKVHEMMDSDNMFTQKTGTLLNAVHSFAIDVPADLIYYTADELMNRPRYVVDGLIIGLVKAGGHAGTSAMVGLTNILEVVLSKDAGTKSLEEAHPKWPSKESSE